MRQRARRSPPLALAAGLALIATALACDSGPAAVSPDMTAAQTPTAPGSAPDAGRTAPQPVVDGPAPRPPGLPSRPIVSELDISPARAVFEDARREAARGERDEAIRLYQQAVTIDPEHHIAWSELFDLLQDGPDPDAAADACAGLLAAQTLAGHAGAVRNLECAVAHLQAERLEQAEEYARQAVSLGDGRLEPLITLSAIQIQRGDYQGVVDLLATHVRTHGGPQEASALSNLGTAYARLHQLEPAIEAYREAATLDPTRVEHQLNLYDALVAAGRPDEAQPVLAHARALAPEDPRVQSRSAAP